MSVSLRRSLTRLLRGRCKVQLPRRWGGHFRNDYDHRDFTSIGAAAGASPCMHGCPALAFPPKSSWHLL